jgi:hypothetical protein
MSKLNIDIVCAEYEKQKKTDTDLKNTEIEIRFKEVDLVQFKIIYDKLKAKTEPIITQKIHTLMPGTGLTNIKEQTFNNNVKDKTSLISKKRLFVPPLLGKMKNGMPYNVSVSTEEMNVKPFIIDSSAMIRIKLRASFVIDSWSYDLTIVKKLVPAEITSTEQLKTIKDSIFTNDMFTVISKDPTVTAEIECEYVGTAVVTASLVNTMISSMETLIGSNASSSYVTMISERLGVGDTTRNPTLKNLLPQVIMLNRDQYKTIYPPLGWYVTDKSDGVRCLAMVVDNKGIICTNQIQSDFVPASSSIPNLCVDGELIDGKVFAFDVLYIAEEDIFKLDTATRLSRIDTAVAHLNTAGIKAQAKTYHHVYDETILKQAVNTCMSITDRPIDGIIMISPNTNYLETKSHKWKPETHNTIDFLVMKVPESSHASTHASHVSSASTKQESSSKSGTSGKSKSKQSGKMTSYYLFVGIYNITFQQLGLSYCDGYDEIFKNQANTTYFPIQFTPASAPYAYKFESEDDSLNMKCVEMIAANINGPYVDWKIVKVREDKTADVESKKYFGNDFYVAEMTWLNYVDPLTLEQLINGVGIVDYFSSEKDTIYKAQTAMISFAKTSLINTLTNYGVVVDFGTGKGQDIFRYMKAAVKTLIAIDSDKAALAELVRRRYSTNKDCKGCSTTIIAIHADVNEDHDIVYSHIARFGVVSCDAVVCNLAVHYFLKSQESMSNFAVLVKSLIKSSGRVILTILDGIKVYEKLKQIEYNQSWDLIESEAKKFSIRKLYQDNELVPAGQSIGVLLPFSSGQYYNEFLVNTTALINEFVLRGFDLESYEPIINELPNFESQWSSVASALTDVDKEYLQLFSTIIFKKQ